MTPKDILNSLPALTPMPPMPSIAAIQLADTLPRHQDGAPLDDLKRWVEQRSGYMQTTLHAWQDVAAADAYVSPIDGKRKKCHCGKWAYKWKLCPYHYYLAHYDLDCGEPLQSRANDGMLIRRQYLTVAVVPME